MTVDPRHEVAASALVNMHTFGIVRDTDNGPVEEVTSAALVRDIATELAAAEARGRVEGLREANGIAVGQLADDFDWCLKHPDEKQRMMKRADRVGTIIASIDARISALSKAPTADTEMKK